MKQCTINEALGDNLNFDTWLPACLPACLLAIREIIGRNERNEVSPSVEVADSAPQVTLDYLAGDSDKANFNKQTLRLIDEIEELEPSVKENSISWLTQSSGMPRTSKAYS